MSYLLKSSAKKRFPVRTKFALGILLIVAVIHFIFPRFWGSALHIVFSPAWKAENYTVGVFKHYGSLVKSKSALIRENIELEKMLAENQSVLVAMNALLKENHDLKANFGRTPHSESVLAAVLRRPNFSSYDTLVVDAGSNLGVQVGSRVVAGENVDIGEISQVYPQSSVVTLYSSPDRETLVFVGPDRIQLKAHGKGGGNFEIKVPRGVELEVGDPIMLPGMFSKIFGVIEKIEARDTDAFQSVTFKVPVNISGVSWVEIIRQQ